MLRAGVKNVARQEKAVNPFEIGDTYDKAVADVAGTPIAFAFVFYAYRDTGIIPWCSPGDDVMVERGDGVIAMRLLTIVGSSNVVEIRTNL